MAAIFQSFARLIPTQPLSSISITTSPKHVLRGHEGNVQNLVFLQDNVHIVSSSLDGTMCKWDCEKGNRVGEPWRVDGLVTALALSPDGKTIACGMHNGNVERWDTNGQMMEGIWTGHSNWVRALSWSPSGGHLASGSWDGTILIRKAESGEVEVGPINANQGKVWSVAYSPSGERIASGADNISIWDSNTGELLVGPIEASVYNSIVWSLDGSKMYSSGWPACVFDSTSGTELHCFQNDNFLLSISLLPKHNLLAGVSSGIIQLWDTESHQPLGQPFYLRGGNAISCVSFSPDGRYLAYSGNGGRVMLRMIKDRSPQPPVPASSTNLQSGTPQEPILASPSSSHPDVDATNPLAQSAVDDIEGSNDPYKTAFFTPSLSSHPSPLPNRTRIRRLRDALSRPHHPTNESRRFTRSLFSRRALSNSPLHAPAHTEQTGPISKVESTAGHHDEERNNVNRFEAGAADRDNGKGKRREEPIPHNQTSTPHDLASSDELDSNGNRALWKSLLRDRKKDGRKAPADVTQDTSLEVVEVYAQRVPKLFVVLERKSKKKSAARVPSSPTAPPHAGGSSQGGPSSHGGHAHTYTLPQGQSGPSSQVSGINRISDDSHSDWSIEGPWRTFLDKICYPCGH